MMNQFGWEQCPYPARDQVATIRDGLLNVVGDQLVGVYLHGSLAMGCFNPERSDIDLLAVVRAPLPAVSQRQIAALLLDHSAPYEPPLSTRPVELSIVRLDQLFPWTYPTPHEFHYSELLRESLVDQIATGAWRAWAKAPHTDPDLAAHIRVITERGISLYGAPIPDIFPLVPEADFIAALHSDSEWTLHHMAVNPVYCVLSLCRVAAYTQDRTLCSKDEGARWALAHLPAEYRPVVAQALAIYRGEAPESPFEPEALEGFAALMATWIAT